MSIHKPVLLKESIEALNLEKGDIVVDATLGGGGHSREILKAIGNRGILIGIDNDINAIKYFAEFLISNFQFPNKLQFPIFKIKNAYLINSNFANLGNILENLKIKKVNAIIADFGLSSDQIENAERGFSFQKDGPLDMRMGKPLRITRLDSQIPLVEARRANRYEYTNRSITAREIVNNYQEKQLAEIFRTFGDEKYSGKIAKAIVLARKAKPITTTKDLVEIIEKAVPQPYKHRRIHFATKTFLALRMEVNNELANIKIFLSQAIDALEKKGRLAAISFHSGEDKLVKNFFRENAGGCVCPKEFPICICGGKPKVKIITKRPIIPMEKEIRNNPRARSAKMRVIERI